ncbi:ABC1 family-domain-containing protein [Phlyctochytrium arcticum]|nr:ABC1 family-domain-containing protein [Phlyctochytrium arcticum]
MHRLFIHFRQPLCSQRAAHLSSFSRNSHPRRQFSNWLKPRPPRPKQDSHNFKGPSRTALGWLLLGGVPIIQLTNTSSQLPTTTHQALLAPSPSSGPAAAPRIHRQSESARCDILIIFDKAVSLLMKTLKLSFRFVNLAVLFGPVILTFPVWYLLERHALKRGERPRLWWVSFLVWSFETSGPTFTKLGQWASSRTDLFPPYVCEILSRLQSKVSPHSLNATRRVIEQEYGLTLEDMFEEFDETPIGVGAIAQVHTGVLRPSEATKSCSTLRCAVKVLHPGVSYMINADLTIMWAVASLINLLPEAEWLSIPDEVEMFGHMMREQLDLRHEARNLERFRSNFKERPRVGFPAPVMPLVRQTVLIEEFVDAIPIPKFLNGGHTPFDQALGRISLDFFLHMLIIDNFVHADLHPGNIFVTFFKPGRGPPSSWLPSFGKEKKIDPPKPEDFLSAAEAAELSATPPSEWVSTMEKLYHQGYTPRIILLDAGLVSELSMENLRNFLDLFRAVAEFDGRGVARLMVARSRTPHTVIDKEGFEDTMGEFLDQVKQSTLKLGNIKVGDILAKVFTMVRQHHIKIEGDFANVGVSIMLLEGVGRRLDKDIDLLHEALPVLREAARLGQGGEYAGPAGDRAHQAHHAFGELGAGKIYWMSWMYHKLRTLTILAEKIDVPVFEDARIYFPE